MGCNNGKTSNRLKNKQQTYASSSDPFISVVDNLKREIKVIRSCFFKVAKVSLIKMSTITSDIEWVQKSSKIRKEEEIKELSTCYKINIFQRGLELHNLLASQLQQLKTENIFDLNTSIDYQKSEKKVVLDDKTIQLLHFCEISAIIANQNQENIEDSQIIQNSQNINNQQNQHESHQNIPIELVA